MVLTVSFALSPGRRALLPPSPGGSLRSRRSARDAPQGLAPASGARTTRLLRPRTSAPAPRQLACARRRDRMETPSAPCRTAPSRRSRSTIKGFPPCDPVRADAVAATASQPRVVTIAIRPFDGPGWQGLYASLIFPSIRIFGIYEFPSCGTRKPRRVRRPFARRHWRGTRGPGLNAAREAFHLAGQFYQPGQRPT